MNREKIKRLIEITQSNPDIMRVFDALDQMDIPEYYIGAGAIVQNVWNSLTRKPQNYGITDIDIVYFDPNSVNEEAENRLRQELATQLGEFPFALDVKNQARVHLWYQQKFGYTIEPYQSLEEAIDTWPTTATALGMRRLSQNKWLVYAPFGFEDVFELTIIPNNRQITPEIYQNKVDKWTGKWPELVSENWSENRIPIKNPKPIRFEQ